jgi:acetyltransferase-like isoleucine patch superfamily enzyme
MTLRVWLHRCRGVKLGRGVWIGYDAIIETAHPQLVSIGDGSAIGMRAMIIAHFRESRRVCIEQNVVIGPGAIILPNVTIGTGSVVTAGSVVTRSVPPMTVVQGNPARPVARCGVPLSEGVSLREFVKQLKTLEK